MVTRQTLDLLIQVRILVSQPILPDQFSSLVGESLAEGVQGRFRCGQSVPIAGLFHPLKMLRIVVHTPRGIIQAAFAYDVVAVQKVSRCNLVHQTMRLLVWLLQGIHRITLDQLRPELSQRGRLIKQVKPGDLSVNLECCPVATEAYCCDFDSVNVILRTDKSRQSSHS